MYNFREDPRFAGLKPLKNKALLSSPTMHGEELEYMKEAYDSGWMTTVGSNIDAVEDLVSSYMSTGSRKCMAAALSSGTAAVHLAVKLAAEEIYGSSSGIRTPDGRSYGGALLGKRVFCSDLTFSATVNPIVYEGGEPVFVDSEYETWNMDPEALERAFALYPDVKIVVYAHLYGNPGGILRIREICRRQKAVLIEDAAEALGAGAVTDSGMEIPAGAVGDYGIISFNGNKIITGSSGGMLIVFDENSYQKAKKWSTQSREAVPWYEHKELGYNYRMSNVIAGVARGQWRHLYEHIEQKRAVYERYKTGLSDLPLALNPMDNGNYWLSCVLIDAGAMAYAAESGSCAVHESAAGKSCPDEVLGALAAFGAEGRHVWKPMHMQPVFAANGFVTKHGNGRVQSCAGVDGDEGTAVSADIFCRGFCLPSDNKLEESQVEYIIDLVHRCFKQGELWK